MSVSIAGREVFNNSQINSGDINNPDIDGGTIDGTVIGGSSAAAGKFTSLEAQTAKVTGGTPGVGKILTSDAVGNASWENAPSGTVPDSGTTANLPLVSDGAHGYSIASRDIRDIANLARVPNQGVAMTSATSGSNGITVADNDNIDFGTGNYTLVWKGSIPDWTPSSAVVLIQKTDGTNGWILQVATSGVLQLVRNAEAAKSSTAAPSITDGTTHEIVCVVTTETASVAGSVVFYVDGVQLGDTVTITAGSPTTVSNSTALYVAGTSSTRSASTTYHAYTFNRALTAAEVLGLYRNGIAEADKWGSQTECITDVNNRDFSSSTIGNWTAIRNGDGVLVYDAGPAGEKTGLYTVGSSIGTYCYLCLPIGSCVPSTKEYKKYFISADVYIPSSNNHWSAVETALLNIDRSSVTQVKSVNLSLTDTWQTITGIISFADDIAGYFAIRVWSTVTGDKIYIDNISIKQLGATLALEPEGIQPAPGQWIDSSTNKLHAMQPATGSSLTRKKDTFEVRWTNTWAGTHEAQYIGGVNQAVLPTNAYIESIIGVVSGTTIEDIIIGDGSDTDRWVEITTGLAAGTYSFALANRVSDGTNKKIVVDPDANFTGSIAWTIKGIILQ